MWHRESHDIEAKTKKWITLIQTGKLNCIAQDVQETICHQSEERLDKSIFKCLLYLSHAADKCDKQDYSTGKDIFELADLFCTNLVKVPDYDKFLLSVYHITRCLVATRLYNEAGKICQHLILGKQLREDFNSDEVFMKTVSLWRSPISEAFRALEVQPLCPEVYDSLKIVVTNELRVIQALCNNFTKHLFVKVRTYLDKIALIGRGKSNEMFDDFYKYIFTCIGFEQLTFDEANKFALYSDGLGIISRIICENIIRAKETAENIINITYSCFMTLMSRNEECYRCFQLFNSICESLLKPVEQLTSDDGKNIHKYAIDCALIGKTYGYDGAAKSMAISAAQILEPLCMRWENGLKAGKKQLVCHGVLLATMKFITVIDVIFLKQMSYKCKCQSDLCTVSRDLYNATVTKIQCIHLVTKLSRDDLSKDICVLTCKLLEQSVSAIKEMRECGCKYWIRLWSTCGTLMYNMGIVSKNFYKETSFLFSLLCSSIIHFEGIQSKSTYLKNLQNPICSTLHRLSTAHYSEGMYREAMTVSALNGLLSYRDINSKAFRMWADILHKRNVNNSNENLSMVACLREDRDKIQKEIGFQVDFSRYDLTQLCLREAKALQEAKVNLSHAILMVLDELRSLRASFLQRSYVTQMLGYHLLSYDHEECITDYLREAISNLNHDKVNYSASVICSEANLKFYEFVNELNARNKRIQAEIKGKSISLYPKKRSDAQANESCDVIPAYFSINIKEDTNIMVCLEESLNKWSKCFARPLEERTTEYWILTLTLHTLIIAGEYSRLFRNQDCEMRAWMLAHKLATELHDLRALIYVTGRAVSLRQLNDEWITNASHHALNLRRSDDEEMLRAIAVFWISLSDYYFELGRYDEARQLIDDARNLPNVSFLSNVSIYLLSLDTIIRNYHLYENNVDHHAYSSYIVECLYTMINLHESLTVKKWWRKDEFLFAYDTLFTASVNMSSRMNSMLSFREISAHLVNRLKAAQALGATIRIAELLKSLCLIDLSRSKLDDCEVKLQGLEHIMHIETFCQSAKARIGTSISLPPLTSMELVRGSPNKTAILAVDPIRDMPDNDTSPVLKCKPFAPPSYLQFSNCNCYACRNPSCQYLFLVSTYIKGQMYALRNQTQAALTHFDGAFRIAGNLFRRTRTGALRQTTPLLSWHERFYLIDYILLLLDFSSFLSKEDSFLKYDEALQIAMLAADLCITYRLKGHPVYLSSQELLVDIRFQHLSKNASQTHIEFLVPDRNDIDISRYMNDSKVNKKVCVTPTAYNIDSKKPPSIRRNRTPPVVKLAKVTINLSEDDEGVSPIATTRIVTRKRTLKSVRRKILDSDYKGSKGKTVENQSLKDIIAKLAPSVPILSDHLYKFANDLNEPVNNQNMDKLIDMVENLKIDIHIRGDEIKVADVRRSKRLSADEHTRKINEAIEMFKKMITSEKWNYSNDRTRESSITSEGAIDKR